MRENLRSIWFPFVVSLPFTNKEHPILSRVESMSAAEVGDPRRGHFTGCRNQPPVLMETRLAPRRLGRVSRKEKAPASIGALPYAITERSPRANLSGSRGTWGPN